MSLEQTVHRSKLVQSPLCEGVPTPRIKLVRQDKDNDDPAQRFCEDLPAVCLLEIYITEVTSLLNQHDLIFLGEMADMF